MIQLHILLMKHEPKSRFQSSTNIPSNLLCKHLSWNPDNKELTFNAFITFASWNRKKKRNVMRQQDPPLYGNQMPKANMEFPHMALLFSSVFP